MQTSRDLEEHSTTFAAALAAECRCGLDDLVLDGIQTAIRTGRLGLTTEGCTMIPNEDGSPSTTEIARVMYVSARDGRAIGMVGLGIRHESGETELLRMKRRYRLID